MFDQRHLHGIRHQAVTRKFSERPEEKEIEATRKTSVWERRYNLTAAKKSMEWSDFYLSASATQTNMAGFLSIKDERSLDDAEYFCTYIPKAVIDHDYLYKQLLSIYNSLYYWGEKGLIKGKRILLAVNDHQAAELVKSGNLPGKLPIDTALILKTINDYCRKMAIETRVPILDLEPEETVTHALLYRNNPKWKNQLDILLSTQIETPFRAKERIFPPVCVVATNECK